MKPGPDFLCVGPRKSATTWLADQLKFQLDFWLPPIQELRYLHDRFRPYRGTEELSRISWTPWEVIKRVIRNRGWGVRADTTFYGVVQELADREDLDLEGYGRLFAPKQHRLSGDISPIYACLDDDVIARTIQAFPRIKVLLFGRNPADRFWSDLSMFSRKGYLPDFDPGDPTDLQEFFDKPKIRCQAFLTEVVDRWMPELPREQFRFISFDDICDDPDRMFDEIVEFLGGRVERRIPFVPKGLDRKKGDRKLPRTEAAKDWMRETFQDELDSCRERFGGRTNNWTVN